MRLITTLCLSGCVLLGTAGILSARDSANEDPKKGKPWSRSAKSAAELKKQSSSGGDDVKAKGGVIMGDSDAPYTEQDTDIEGPELGKIKNIGHLKGQLVAVDGTIDGDSDTPYALTGEEIKMLNSDGDVVICGKSGELVNTKQWKEPGKMCRITGFKYGAPRHQLLILGKIARLKNDKKSIYYLNDQEMKRLSSHEDVKLSGKTGEIVGIKGWNKAVDSDKGTGFNKQSPRFAILKHYKALKKK